ncbi:zinc finger protein 574-like [Mantella aurantiaca]
MSGDAAMTESEETVLYIEHRYVCSECGVEFPNLEDVVVHQQSHTTAAPEAQYQLLDLGSHENQYQCLECGQLLLTPSDLLAHQELHLKLLQSPSKPESLKAKRPSRSEIHYECQECKALFNSQDMWLAHRYTHMEPQNVPQSKVLLQTDDHVMEDSIQLMCDPSTPGEVHLVAGQQHFHVPTSSSAAVSHTQVLVDLEHSYKKSEGVTEECAVEVLFYKCSECTQLFQTPGEFLEHQATHFQGQENALEASSQPDETAQPLANEQVVEEQVKVTTPSDHSGQVRDDVSAPPEGKQVLALNNVTLPCASCNASFKSEREFKTHLLSHTTGRFSCPLCSYVFPTHADVEEHLKSHQSEHHYLCVDCGLGFASEFVLVNHRLTHQVNPLYACECGQTFVNMTKFLYHRRMHSTKPQEPVQVEEKISDITSVSLGGFLCTICGKSFSLVSQLFQHQHYVHVMERRHKCPTCSKSFKKRSHLRNHMLTHTGERPFSCSVCSKSFNAQANLLRHKLTHTGEKPHKCQLCGKAFSQSSTLQQHLVVHSQTYPYKCTECGLSFHRPYRLLMHQYHHTGEYPYKCQVCGLSFLLKRLLEVHELGHRGEEPFRCVDCGANYPSSQRLKDHRCNRTGGEPGDRLECPVCGKKVYSDNQLNAHVSSQHTGTRNASGCQVKNKQPLPAKSKLKVGPRYLECPDCHKSFSTETSLHVHRRIHTGERPYPCQVCGKAFRQSTHLKDHVRIHTGEKPFKCDVCGKAFTIAVRLTEHKRIHTGERPHVCPECGRAYRSFSNLWKHRKLHREQTITTPDHEAHTTDLSSTVAIVETVETIPIIETVEIFPEGSAISVQDIQFETLQVENIHLGNIQIGTL